MYVWWREVKLASSNFAFPAMLHGHHCYLSGNKQMCCLLSGDNVFILLWIFTFFLRRLNNPSLPQDNIHPRQRSQIPLENPEAHYNIYYKCSSSTPCSFTCVYMYAYWYTRCSVYMCVYECMVMYLRSTFILWRGKGLSLNPEFTLLAELTSQQVTCIVLSVSPALGLHVYATELDFYMEIQSWVFMTG